MATKTDCRNAIINAYGCILRDDLHGAHEFVGDAYKMVGVHVNGEKPFDSEPHQIVRSIRDWWIVRQLNPLRWFKRVLVGVAADRSVTLSAVEKPKRRVTLKKAIVLILCSVGAGVGSNYVTSDIGGPIELERGQFTQIQQCDSCTTIRTGGNVCAQCGTSSATQRIAAPLKAQHLGGFFQSEAGWQFKDGSTQLYESGEYVVPELVVTKTMRM